MESLAALGLAANIVQFLEFGRKLVSGTLEICRSEDGASSSNRVLHTVTEDLHRLCNDLSPQQNGNAFQSKNSAEAGLFELMDSCNRLGQELLQKLESLKVKGAKKRWRSGLQVLKGIWYAEEVSRYEKQLDQYRSQIALRLLTMLGEQHKSSFAMQSNLLEQQGNLRQALDRLAEDHDRLDINSVNKPKELTETIVTSLENLNIQQSQDRLTLPRFQPKGDEHETEKRESNRPIQLPQALVGWLRKLQSETLNLNDQVQILETLQFPQIFERVENIRDAHNTTFEWLFDETENFVESGEDSCILRWLRHGSKTFWVSGKAGSGKSTLMKFFHQNEKTIAALERWASGQKLIVASFFFWHAGTAMQKSQQGLLQTLLAHILRQAPALMPIACPSRWWRCAERRQPWSRVEIFEAFSNIQKSSIDSKFCFFVDGLDEYDGDHLDLIKVLEGLIAEDIVKLCFSSRPWNVFETYYGENGGQRLRLQDLSRSDIANFTRDKLAEGNGLCSKHPFAYEDLVREIVSKADGVFLWVFLVVRSLRRGMTNLDTPKELQARLRELPPDLESFFQRILDSSERVYRRQASRLYLIQLNTTEEVLTAHDISFFAEDEADFGLNDESVREYSVNINTICEKTRIRVHARCQDLLEFDEAGRLRFLHRTVKDFLEIKDIKDQLESRVGSTFNVHRFVCNSSLLQLRSMALHPASMGNTPIHEVGVRTGKHIQDSFWDHICQADTDEQWPNQLLFALDRAMWIFTNSPNFNVKWRLLCCHSESLGSGHHKGWLADKAAKKRYDRFLTRSVGSVVQVISADGNVVSVPPLTCSLEYMVSDHRVEYVNRLLNLGADPNQILESGISIWDSYLKFLHAGGNVGLDNLNEDHTELLEMLLHCGAEPDVPVEIFDDALSMIASNKDDITKLKDLRESLVSEQRSRHEISTSRSPRPQTRPQLPKWYGRRREREESISSSRQEVHMRRLHASRLRIEIAESQSFVTTRQTWKQRLGAHY